MKYFKYFIYSVILIAGISNILAQFPVVPDHGKGNLIIIGGGNRGPEIMNKIIELSGGKSASILIIPNASYDPVEAIEYMTAEFIELGVSKLSSVNLKKDEVDTQANFDKLNDITAIYFTGGDQSRLTDLMTGSKFLEMIHEKYNAGFLIAGTSAGAAIQSEIMITGNELISQDSSYAYGRIQEGNIENVKGFGFVTEGIIDQHFIRRKRMNRLHTLVLENPELLGIGIDEGTALWVKPDRSVRILGDSGVFLYDARNAEINKREDGSYSTKGFQLNILYAGDEFHL